MDFGNGAELLEICKEQGITISEVMIKREMATADLVRSDVINRMHTAYDIMKQSIAEALAAPKKSMGGLIGGEAIKMHKRRLTSKPVCGEISSKAAMYAMGVLEINASMGMVVASPTAGSSGVIPGTFLAIQEEFGFTDEKMVEALFTAGAVGYLITRNAAVSGAAAGCQAEVGSASAMAAAAICRLMDADAKTSLSAAAMALSNLLGLVCDPIGGLVEEPCQKRNAIGASNALISAEIALSGISFIIPFDEMVEVMYTVGTNMPVDLRETAMGGIAVAPSVAAIMKDINEKIERHK